MFEVYMEGHSVDPRMRARMMMALVASLAVTTAAGSLSWAAGRLSIGTVGPPQGLLFFNQVTSNKNIEFVAGAVHFMPTTEGGRDSLETTLLSVAQSTTLNVTQWPHAGQQIALEVRGEPGAAYELFAVAGVGTAVETPEQSLANGFLDGVTGRALVVLDVPETMAGMTLTHRAVTSGVAQELLRTTVLPGM